jgi:YebC/PmpR family DNA-binding regulatory protein
MLAAGMFAAFAANIERALKRGTGEIEGAVFEEASYEGYAPGGVAVLVEVATDNRNRTSGDVRHILTKYGGSMAAAGAVSYLFKPRGVIEVARGAVAEEALFEIVLEAGADDVQTLADTYEVLTPPARFEAVREALAAQRVPIQSAEMTKLPATHVALDPKGSEAVLRLVDELEEHEDVQKVYANLELSDELLGRMAR